MSTPPGGLGELVPTAPVSPLTITSDGPDYTDADWHLDPGTLGRLVDAMPPNTRRTYRWALREYATWCVESGRVPLPATGATLTAYVDHLIINLNRPPATVESVIGAIRALHKNEGYDGQPNTAQALLLLRGYRRDRATDGVDQRQAVPFTKVTLHQCIETLDLSTLPGRRTQVVLVFGFTMMARRHVLSALRFADITETPDGLDVRVRRDKADKRSEGRTCSLLPQPTCDGDPVRVLHAWRSQLAATGVMPEHLLCRFTKNLRPLGPLSGDSINTIVRTVAGRAGLPDAHRYTAHSLRAGGLVDALQRGVVPGIAARHGGWEPESPMLGRYSRVANRWRDNAMRDAL